MDEVSQDLRVPFNAMLLRLYFDGNDEIAWHTDGRTFLGNTPTIASLSFGASATFQMRRMHNVWPPLDGSAGDCVDRDTSQRDFVVRDGDMLVMRGNTQKHWHHRVPKEKGRRPRLNINFRYILGGLDAERGQKTYYKYMVHGDEEKPRAYSYKEIMAMRGGMMNFVKGNNRAAAKSSIMQDDAAKATNDEESAAAAAISKSSRGDNNDDDIQAYLASENVDGPTFMALPGNIRTELINDWQDRQNQSPRSDEHVVPKRAASVGNGSRSNPKRQKKAGGTIDAFFSCKK